MPSSMQTVGNVILVTVSVDPPSLSESRNKDLKASLYLYGAFCDELVGDNAVSNMGTVLHFLDFYGAGLEKVPFSHAGVLFYGELLINAQNHQGSK